MLRRDTEYVLTWNAVDYTWDVYPIRRDGTEIVRLDSDATHVGPSLLLDSPSTITWDD